MPLSVVIPSYNQRGQLTACLDALGTLDDDDHEVIVVNGPSTDGTSGAMEQREDVDCLLECSSRNLNVARNIGLREASRDYVAFLSPQYRVTEGWARAILETLEGHVDAVSGPTGPGDEAPPDEIGDRPATDELTITGGNMALTRGAVTALDGFDEYLDIGGTRDIYRRLTHEGLHLVWHPDMRVEPIYPADDNPEGDGGLPPAGWQDRRDPGWGVRYRSRAYLEVKNDGLRPGVIARLAGAALRDGSSAAADVLRGNGQPTAWMGNGVSVVRNVIVGIRDGRAARRADRTPARNPHGLSRADEDRIAARIDRRSEAPP